VFVAHQTGVTPTIAQTDDVARGVLARAAYDRHGRLEYVEIRNDAGEVRKLGTLSRGEGDEDIDPADNPLSTGAPHTKILKVESGVEENKRVVMSRYEVRGVKYYELRLDGTPLAPEYDEESLPRYLFLGAAGVSLLILLVLYQQMPDLFGRAFWVLRSLGQTRLHVVGTYHLPTDGPVVLVTNCRTEADRHNVVAATDRLVHFVAPDLSEGDLAATLRHDAVLALAADDVDRLSSLQPRLTATYLPVYHGPMLLTKNGSAAPAGPPRVAFGPPLPPDASPPEVANAIQQAGAMTEEEH
jgi:hypothetical protein